MSRRKALSEALGGPASRWTAGLKASVPLSAGNPGHPNLSDRVFRRRRFTALHHPPRRPGAVFAQESVSEMHDPDERRSREPGCLANEFAGGDESVFAPESVRDRRSDLLRTTKSKEEIFSGRPGNAARPAPTAGPAPPAERLCPRAGGPGPSTPNGPSHDGIRTDLATRHPSATPPEPSCGVYCQPWISSQFGVAPSDSRPSSSSRATARAPVRSAVSPGWPSSGCARSTQGPPVQHHLRPSVRRGPPATGPPGLLRPRAAGRRFGFRRSSRPPRQGPRAESAGSARPPKAKSGWALTRAALGQDAGGVLPEIRDSDLEAFSRNLSDSSLAPPASLADGPAVRRGRGAPPPGHGAPGRPLLARRPLAWPAPGHRDPIPAPARPTSPQSQSFSRSYGSGLPTSLTYIVLSTRGCSPWRPAAVMACLLFRAGGRPPRGRIPPWPSPGRPTLSVRLGALPGGPPTRGPDRLLGPCFKTGRQDSRQSSVDPRRLRAADTDPAGDHRPAATGGGHGELGPPEGREAQPSVPSSALRPARPRPVSRLSDRPPVGGPGLPEEPQPAGLCWPGCPAGRGRRAREKCTRPGLRGSPWPRPMARGVRGRGGHRAGRCAGRAESPGPDLCGPPVCFSTASRTLKLPLRSAFQLSIMVLVLYRSSADI
ncbi:basic proline-rich protein-like [Acanthaster planci]|uniref:Basic proline-rich protein-like n=1 Tax=Acanthaster planci TaxID=133434 RepID=A0A8B7YRG8_ACAPL|nr:basic proline-rich protein-like [Acanthaster planci]